MTLEYCVSRKLQLLLRLLTRSNNYQCWTSQKAIFIEFDWDFATGQAPLADWGLMVTRHHRSSPVRAPRTSLLCLLPPHTLPSLVLLRVFWVRPLVPLEPKPKPVDIAL